MSISQSKDLLKSLKPIPAEIGATVLWLRDYTWNLYPQANELIYDNDTALAIGWSPTDRVGHTFCSIAVGRISMNIHYGFYRGVELSDPKQILLGEGNQYRYLLVSSTDKFPAKDISQLTKETDRNSLAKSQRQKAAQGGLTIVKSASEKKAGEKNVETR
jgi:hypothetical protein